MKKVLDRGWWVRGVKKSPRHHEKRRNKWIHQPNPPFPIKSLLERAKKARVGGRRRLKRHANLSLFCSPDVNASPLDLTWVEKK